MTTSAPPPVSIGLPVYNGERYLRETLRSLQAQTFADFELVITDNASTDSTEEICREHAATDTRIRYYKNQTNRGAAYNYNRAVELARGRYFKWNADDDLVDSAVVARCFAVLEAEPDVILCYPRTKIIDSLSRVVGDYDDRLVVRAPRASDRFVDVMTLTGECNAVFGLIRTDVLRRTARIGKYFGSDVVLLGELSLYGQFDMVENTVFFRRDHPEASSSDKSYRNLIQFYDPGSRRRFMMPNWRHQTEYLKAILRSPLPAAEKTRSCLFLVRRTFHVRSKLVRDVRIALRCLLTRRRDDEAQRLAR